MSVILSPLVSEFETAEQEASYLAWLNDKVRRSLEDTRPTIAHDQVLGEVRNLLETQKNERASG